MKRLLILLGLLLITLLSFSQQIEIQKKALGTNFYHHGERLTLSSLQKITTDIPQAQRYIKQARTSNVFACIFAGIGGYCIGYPLGTAIAGGNPNWNLALIGGGFLTVGVIPLAILTNNKTIKAVNIYNQSKSTSKSEWRYDLNLAATQNGIGIIISF